MSIYPYRKAAAKQPYLQPFHLEIAIRKTFPNVLQNTKEVPLHSKKAILQHFPCLAYKAFIIW
jgi:hypothetical protein